MIRINLLEGAIREVVEELPAEPVSAAAFQVRAFVVGLMVAASLVVGAYWFLNRRLDRLNQQLEIEKREATRLAAIQAENTRYSAQLNDINRRIEVLQLLERGRRAPGQLMMQLASMVNSSPELYLTSVTPQGNRIVVSGASGLVSSIATFVKSLRTGDGFTDVQLHEYYEDDEKDGRVSFKFSLDFSYLAPAAEKIAASGGKERAPAGKSAHGT